METKTIPIDVRKKIRDLDAQRMAKISERAETVKLPTPVTKTAVATILMGDN